MKIATIQMNCKFADFKINIKKAEILIRDAKKQNADMALLPEFFTLAIGFSPKMNNIALQGLYVRDKLKKWSEELDIIIGGSYLLFDGINSYNNFDLAFPDGSIYTHRKDIPTQFENCYYTNGDENNILHTPIGNIGVALCWEMLRSDTLKRLTGKVSFVLTGSCWWDLPVDAPPEREKLRQYNQKLALETPCTFAKLLHVPVIHANHCGTVTANNFPNADKTQTRQLVGATQIIDKDGRVLKRRNFNEGEGIIIQDVNCNNLNTRQYDYSNLGYWISTLPNCYLDAWNKLNPLGKEYYNSFMLNYYKQQFELT